MAGPALHPSFRLSDEQAERIAEKLAPLIAAAEERAVFGFAIRELGATMDSSSFALLVKRLLTHGADCLHVNVEDSRPDGSEVCIDCGAESGDQGQEAEDF